MKVLKFGGTSLGSAKNIRQVAKLISNMDSNIIVVLSAMSGTTNSLIEIALALRTGKIIEAEVLMNNLETNYLQTVEKLFTSQKYKKIGHDIISKHFIQIKNFTLTTFDIFQERSLVAQGELLSRCLTTA